MARARKSESGLQEGQVQGLRYFGLLNSLLKKLHEVGAERDRAGNRDLFMDQYCMLMLLFLFNPAIDSLRTLQRVGRLDQVRRKLRLPGISLGSLSESVAVFDPAPLRCIIDQLASKVQPVGDVSRGHVKQLLTAVDGSVIKTLSTVAEAAYLKNRFGESKSAWRLHTQFYIDHQVPRQIEVTSGLNSGKSDEKNVLRANLAADHCYVLDRWYAEFKLFNEIHACRSSYVCRLRDNSNLTQVSEARTVSPAAQAAGVLADEIVQLGTSDKARTNHPVRVIQVTCSQNTERGRRGGGRNLSPSDGVLRIATNLLEVPAEVIADIFRHRWSIEIFFKFFKQLLGCRHLLSQKQQGVEIQVYCAIIACLLIHIWTGHKPNKATFQMVWLYLQGWATQQELLQHIEKMKAHNS